MSETAPAFNEIIGTNVAALPKPSEGEETAIAGSGRGQRRRRNKALDEDGNPMPSVWGTNERAFWGVPRTHRTVPAGTYSVDSHIDLGVIFVPIQIAMDDLVSLPNETVDRMVTEFDTFWSKEPEFKARGFLHKRGFLFWGAPAGGKTSMVNLMALRLVQERSGVVIFCPSEPSLLVAALKMFRSIEPDRPLVVVFEDIDAIIARRGENDLLGLLDGTAQIDHVFFVATTNYPEKLDRRFVDRPSRFDTITHIGMPGAAIRRAFLVAKEPSLGETPDVLQLWVESSRGFSLAHLKEMIISVYCLGQSLEYVVQRLDDMHKRQLSSDDEDASTSRLGFLKRVRGGDDE